MPDRARDDRRRELQRRAFSPGGGLTESEASELRVLSAPLADPEPADPEPGEQEPPAAQEPLAAPVGGSDALRSEGEAERRSDLAGPGEDEATAPGHDATAPGRDATAPGRHRPRPGIPILLLAAVVAVLLGLGVGWLAFGRAGGGPGMTGAQRETLVQLDSSGEFDAGSVALVGTKHGAEAWHATKGAGESECLVLIAEEERQTACAEAGQPNSFGLQANLGLRADGEHVMIWAVLLEDTDGERVAIIQREIASGERYDWRSQYSGRDLEIAEFLDSSGYRGDALQLIGYDDTLPIWMTLEPGELCMLVAEPDALIAEGCASLDPSAGGRLDLGTDRAVYQLNLSENMDPVLTIIRTPDSIVCDTDSGYCGVDDRTGETSG
ncbi:hypothetical protein FVO59_09595 [Microbacterium esteraromaticum]|uniref:Uncharacterized protein n=1 Tax=Microbacterium esteraromaticum TaxID=57043 RepID=A0A7D8AGS9_9MICO|nr:hypothetical protein [Microbacterium esteraromaticum]QMU97443.1 hypothetical protein FVO59_09595 [Microbacterium esteraromaticum]